MQRQRATPMAIRSTAMLLLLAYLAYSQQISDPLGFSGSTFLHNRWNNNECLLGDCIRHPRSDTLLTFTVANVRHRTAGFLSSLASVNDKFDLLAIDEHSTDDTGDDLHAFGVHTLYVKESIGVTALWNEAWQYFMQRSEQYDKLIYSNNDVLVPNGVVDKLKAALDNGCDLVTPMSTVRGKGHVGHIEGLEVVHDLQGDAAEIAINPGNFRAIQHILDIKYSNAPMEEVLWTKRKVFNGFFFALSSRVKQAAFSEALLFNPVLHNFQQEGDLGTRMLALNLTICVHRGTFVYHFKAATIPLKENRQAWRRDTQESI